MPLPAMIISEPTLGAESEIFTVGSDGMGLPPLTENLYKIRSVFTPDETMRVPLTFEFAGCGSMKE